MISIEAITQYDIDLIKELFFDGKCVYISESALFRVDGEKLICETSFCTRDEESDFVSNELRILKIKEIAEGIGYKYVDLRKEVNN